MQHFPQSVLAVTKSCGSGVIWWLLEVKYAWDHKLEIQGKRNDSVVKNLDLTLRTSMVGGSLGNLHVSSQRW